MTRLSGRRIVDYRVIANTIDLQIPQEKIKVFENEQDEFTQAQIKEINDTLSQLPNWKDRLKHLSNREAIQSVEKPLPESLSPSKNGILSQGQFPVPRQTTTHSPTKKEGIRPGSVRDRINTFSK